MTYDRHRVPRTNSSRPDRVAAVGWRRKDGKPDVRRHLDYSDVKGETAEVPEADSCETGT
jgi:hypothetical protein